MKKLLALILTVVAVSCQQPAATYDEPSAPTREYYELRQYHLSSEEQRDALEDFLSEAAIPAMNRAGIEHIGAFTPIDTSEGYDVFLLIAFDKIEEGASLNERLLADAAYLKAGANHLEIKDPSKKAFERIESSLLAAFDSMPFMSVPPLKDNPNRIFELRSYESYSEPKGEAKVKMFNAGGEVEIFHRLGFNPVFFAQAIYGDEQPNLVYMTSFPDAATQDSLWNMFRNDPKWVAIKDLEEYANTVSKIHKYILRPLSCSQI